MHDEMWSALYMYNRQILSYMAVQGSLTRMERLLITASEEFLGLLEMAMAQKNSADKFKLTVLQGGKG